MKLLKQKFYNYNFVMKDVETVIEACGVTK